MADPFSALSDADLKLLAAGDVEGLSTEALQAITSPSGPAPAQEKQSAPGKKYEDMAFDLASRLFPGLGQIDHPEVRKQVANFLRGEVSGITGKDMGQTGTAGSVGKTIGKNAPAIAAGVGAAAAVPTAGLSLVPSALASAAAAGLGATGGESARQLAAGASGNVEEVKPQEAIKTGLITAAADLGIGLPLAGVKAVAPAVLQIWDRIPAESIKRAIQNPSIIKVGSEARNAVERSGIEALRRLQTSFSGVRRSVGKEVESALEVLQKKTGGEKFNLGQVADRAERVLAESGAENKAVANAMGGELGRLRKLIKSVRENQASAKEIVSLRRVVDGMEGFNPGGMAPISSDVGKRVIREIGNGLRDAIDEIATVSNFGGLREANQRFRLVAGLYDEARPLISSKAADANSLLNQFNRLAARFNEGGIRTEIVEAIGSNLPKYSAVIGKRLNRLLDAIAARELTRLPQGTVSGAGLNLIRTLSAPQAVGAAIKSGPAVRQAVRGATIGAAGSASED